MTSDEHEPGPVGKWWAGFRAMWLDPSRYADGYRWLRRKVPAFAEASLVVLLVFWPLVPGIYLILTGGLPNTLESVYVHSVAPWALYFAFVILPYHEGMAGAWRDEDDDG